MTHAELMSLKSMDTVYCADGTPWTLLSATLGMPGEWESHLSTHYDEVQSATVSLGAMLGFNISEPPHPAMGLVSP